MADEVKEIEVETAAEVSLSLHVGGSFSYRSQLYEYPAAGGEPAAAAGEQSGTAPVSIGSVATGAVRRFVWSVVVVSNDDAEQTVEVVGRVLVGSKTVGAVNGTVAVARPLRKLFVNLRVKGKAT